MGDIPEKIFALAVLGVLSVLLFLGYIDQSIFERVLLALIGIGVGWVAGYARACVKLLRRD